MSTSNDTTNSDLSPTIAATPARQIVFRALKVKNIDASVTIEDLTGLLGLHGTPFLKKYSVVQVIGDGDEKFAKVVCPDVAYDELIKLNGLEFHGKKILIEGETDELEDIAQTDSVQNSGSAEADADNAEILHMLLDCRNHPDLNFEPVQEYEVCEALHLSHADDPHKAVKTYHGNRKGTFGIQSTDMTRYVNTSLVIRGHEIKLIAVRKRPHGRTQQGHQDQQKQRTRRHHDPDSLKIRIFDAWDLRHRDINYTHFDIYFQNLGAEIIRTTQPERCRDDPDIFNTNRYLVVKKKKENDDIIDFGNRITVEGLSFKLSYYGIKRYCGLCQKSHGWDCPIKARNDFLRKIREDKTQQSKIYSDSTFRHVNQVALTNDVAVMSGGSIAQLCNAIPYDAPHNEVIVNGGTNELKEDSLKEFAFIVNKTAEKVTKLSENVPVTVILPPISTDVPVMTVKGKYLADTMKAVTNTIQLTAVDMEDTTHPSKDGTFEMLKQIDDITKIMIPEGEDVAVLAPKYRGVQSIFKVGCRGCDNLNFTRSLCTECENEAQNVDVTLLEEQIRILTEQMFPVIEDETMPLAPINNKRGPSDTDDHDENANAAKSARSSAN